jgi:hypothetical protein
MLNRGKRAFSNISQSPPSLVPSENEEEMVQPPKKKRRSKASALGRAKGLGGSKDHLEHRAQRDQMKLNQFGPRASEVYRVMGWDLTANAMVADGGFKGSRTGPRKSLLVDLEQWVKDGSILEKIKGFQKVPYQGVCTRICDSDGK